MSRIRRILAVAAATASAVMLTGCGPGQQADVPAHVEEIEEATESFANFMLDLGVSLKHGDSSDFAAALTPTLEAVPLPGNATLEATETDWILQRDWPLGGPTILMDRDEFLGQLESFIDRFSELDDVRFKVKKSSPVQNAVSAEIALAIVGRDEIGRRSWTFGRASVRAVTAGSAGSWSIDSFVLTTLSSLIGEIDVFSEVAVPARVQRTDPPFLARQGPPFAAYGAAVGDVDNDGLIDLVVTSEVGNSLYLNSGDGTFDDVAHTARIRDVHADVVAPLLLDVDNDGDLDLFVSAIGTQMLFENRLLPDGHLEFWDVSHERGVAVPAIGFSAVAGDIDGNGFPDIYVTSYNRYGQVLPDRWDGASNGTPNLLFLNRGDGTFREVAAERGVADDRWGYAAGFADVDEDGDLDLYQTNDFGGGNALFINQDGSFVDRANEFGVYDGGYGMGVSFGDYDNDGDLDIFLRAMHGEAHHLFRNNIGSERGFVRITLRGTVSGADAFGTVVRLETSAGTLTKIKAGGSGFVSQSDPRLLFGLGQDAAAERLEVTWPSGLVQSFAGPVAGSSILIVEGAEAPVELQEARFTLAEPLSSEERRWHTLGLDPDSPIDDVEVELLDGTRIRLSNLVGAGESLLLNLWATWCRPCAREMPELEHIHREAGPSVRVVGLNIERQAPVDQITDFVNDLGISYPVARIGPEALEQLLGTEDPGVPLSLIIDHHLRPRQLLIGWSEQTEEQLRRLAIR